MPGCKPMWGDARRRMALRAVLWGCALMALLPARPAFAGTGEHEIAGGLVFDSASRVGLAASSTWWWTDLVGFGVAVDGSLAHDAATLPDRVAVRGDVRVAIDALTWVPWLEAGAGAAVHTQVGDVGALLRFGAGVAWRRQRELAWLLRLGWERAMLPRGGDTLQLFVGVGWYRGGVSDLDI